MHAIKYKSKHLNGDPIKLIDPFMGNFDKQVFIDDQCKDKLLEGKSYLHSLTLNHESCIWASKNVQTITRT